MAMGSLNSRGWERNLKYLLVLPSIVALLAISIYPLVYSLYLSFHYWNMARTSYMDGFVGLLNYISVIYDRDFFNALRNTVVFTAGAIPLEVGLGLLLAVLVYRAPFSSAHKVILILPTVLPPIAVGVMGRLILSTEYGVVNYLLSLIGLPRVDWTGEPLWAMLSVILVDVWEWTPFCFLIWLAGLMGIPVQHYEAAEIDGASEGQILRHIVLPQLKPIFLTILFFRVIDSLKLFDIVYILTGGGPGISTETLSFYIYRVAFRHFNMGYAAALSWILAIMVTLIASFIYSLIYKRGE